MKKIMFLAGLVAGISVNSQTTADFENLNLPNDSYWNGSSQPLGSGFTSGNVYMPNYYDTAWGGYWASGWAYSNKTDSTTPGYGNMYSARAGSGYNQSSIYAIGQNNAKIILTGNALGKVVEGLYVTNSTYAYYSMKDGDMFARKFGDTTGTGCLCPQGSYPDWFKLTIKKYYNGTLANDSVEFYLADYRFSDNSQDYIIKDWTWVDLSSLGNADSLLFTLSSSDVGQWGMNTPAFFCVDNIVTRDAGVGISEHLPAIVNVYPNPANDFVYIDNTGNNMLCFLQDATGRLIHTFTVYKGQNRIDLQDLTPGIYFLTTNSTNNTPVKIIKK